jgi:probable O-glycosylation ligase (exosortase A-associated)
MGFFGVKGGLFTIASGGDHKVWGPVGSFIEGNNELALALLITMPLVRYLHLHSKNRWVRWGLLGCMPLFLVSAIGSYSRGAFIAMAAMMVVFAWKSKQRVLIGVVMAFTLVGTLSFMPTSWWDRMDTIQEADQDGSFMGRVEAWGYAVDVATKSPVWGGGFSYNSGFLSEDGTTGRVAHSIYFQTLGAHGFVGLLLFLLLGAASLRTGNWIAKHTRDRPDLAWAHDLASMTRVGLIGFAVGGAALNLAFFDLFYHMLVIISATRFIVGRELAKAPVVTNAPASEPTGQAPHTALPTHSR